MTHTPTRVSYQDAVLADIAYWADRRDYQMMTEYNFSNVGRLLIGTPRQVIMTINFSFNAGGKNMLLINGAQHGPPGPDNYYFDATETERYNQFIARLKELLEAAP